MEDSLLVPMIEAEGLSKYYGDFAAVRELSFSIPAGQVCAFLGPNGAGKSTTMKLLAGYMAPSAGRCRLGGFDVASQRRQAVERLGYLPENGPLYLEMTPLDSLRFFGQARGMPARLLAGRVEAVVEQCALDEVLEKPIHKLSRGYRQRVGMAHALLHDPEVLILDEPTTGLDPNQIRQVRDLIRALGREKTVLLSTHILQEVEAVASRVILISAGRLAFDGPPDGMLASGATLDEAFFNLTAAAS